MVVVVAATAVMRAACRCQWSKEWRLFFIFPLETNSKTDEVKAQLSTLSVSISSYTLSSDMAQQQQQKKQTKKVVVSCL